MLSKAKQFMHDFHEGALEAAREDFPWVDTVREALWLTAKTTWIIENAKGKS